MLEIFENYISRHADLTREELDAIEAAAARRTIRKKEFLTREGNIFPFKSFVLKGCLKAYRLGDAGTEHIIRFATETSWIADSESFHLGKPSPYNIDAMEDSELLLWTKPAFEELIEKIPAYKNFSDKVMAHSVAASQNRIFANISFTAEEKYRAFLEEFPALASRIPLHMIASYLGLSRETLSRVRSAGLKSRAK